MCKPTYNKGAYLGGRGTVGPGYPKTMKGTPVV